MTQSWLVWNSKIVDGFIEYVVGTSVSGLRRTMY